MDPYEAEVAGCAIVASDLPESKGIQSFHAGELQSGLNLDQVSLSLACKNSRRTRRRNIEAWILLPFLAIAREDSFRNLLQ
jgi:hypothetical protein